MITSKTIRWKDEHLLQELTLLWTGGEGKRQNSQCLEAIKTCLLNNISLVEIATSVGNASSKLGRNGQDVDVEFMRAKECARRINKSMEAQQEQEKKIQRLSAVARAWKAGKACPQTSECKALIRKSLIAGISTDMLSSHVAKQLNEEDQARELNRVKRCAKRIELIIATEQRRPQKCGQPTKSILKQPSRKEQAPTVAIRGRKKFLVCKLSFEFDME